MLCTRAPPRLQVRAEAQAAKASLSKLESAWLPRWAEQATRQAAASVGPALGQARQYAAQVRRLPALCTRLPAGGAPTAGAAGSAACAGPLRPIILTDRPSVRCVRGPPL